MRKVAITAPAIAFCCIAVAGQLPPPEHPDLFRGQVASLKQPVTTLAMGAFSVQFEETRLSKARDAIRVGSISHQGDAGASEYWLCYTAGAGTRAQRIWIVASGSMGGPEHRITGVQARRTPDESPTASCPQLPAKFLPLRLDRGAWVGDASAAPDGWTTYGYAGKRGKYDLTSELSVQTSGGKVVALSAYRITSD